MNESEVRRDGKGIEVSHRQKISSPRQMLYVLEVLELIPVCT